MVSQSDKVRVHFVQMNSGIAALKSIIEKEVFVRKKDAYASILENPEAWIFDFRRVLMRGDVSNLIASTFYETYRGEYPFQLCALEVGGIPLLMSIVNKFYTNEYRDINGFFIRKSRKKTGLLNMIEGKIIPEKKIILVDDTMNSGDSFWRQIIVLEELGYKVDTVWSIIRYRDTNFYTRFHNRGIKIKSLFTLNDFTEALGPRVKNIAPDIKIRTSPFETKWIFRSEKPSLNYVNPKSQPILDEDTIYVGSDNRTFWAIDQADGSVRWSFSVGRHVKKKSIFSSPALCNDLVIFGAYDGNLYALDKKSGKQRWVSFEADWIGSSPVVAPELGLVFVGLEFGLFKKHGGIAALDVRTGITIWIDRSHRALTHASPTYITSHEQVVIGSNEGVVRLYDARSGELQWEFTTFGGAEFDTTIDAGFGKGEIKMAIAYDSDHDYLVFGATDGFLYILERQSGYLVHHYKADFAIWSTPFVHKGKVYFTSLDKHVRCMDLASFELQFERNLDGTRLFGSPVVIGEKLYVGTNAARLHELDLKTGESLGYYQTLERITNTLVRNEKTGMFFLPTYANEIICLERLDTRVN